MTYSAPTGAELYQRFQNELDNELGEQLDYDSDTVAGAIAAAFASVVGDLSEATQLAYDQRRLSNAFGDDLEDLISLAGISRREATASEVDLTPTGTGGAPVPTGTEVEGPNGFRWISQEDTQVGQAAIFECQTAGPVSVSSGASWDIVTPVNGVDGFTNASSANVGRPRETDQELIERRNREFSVGTVNREGSVRAAVSNLDFVDAVAVVQNRTDSDATIDGIFLPETHFGVVVYPDTLTSDEETTLAETIYAYGPETIDTQGNQSEVVEAVDGTTQTVRWSYATNQDVTIDVTYTLVSGANASDIEAQFDDRIEAFFGQLDVGEDVKHIGLVGYMTDIDSFDQVEDFTVNLDGSEASVTVPPTKFATYTSVNYA